MDAHMDADSSFDKKKKFLKKMKVMIFKNLSF